VGRPVALAAVALAMTLLVVFRPAASPAADAPAPAVAAAPADPPPERAVVIDPKRKWQVNGWGYRGKPKARNAAFDLEAEHAIFYVGDRSGRNLWSYYLHHGIDRDRYPILVLGYRAVNVDTTSDDVLAWVGDGTTDRNEAAGGGALFCNQVVADGEPHELRKDLREVQTTADWKFVLLGLTASDQGGAMLEVVSLRFEAPPAAPAPAPESDQPITVRVLDVNGQPVAGAIVRTDVERRNFACSATTGADGMATVTPLKHGGGDGSHYVRVERGGFAPLEWVPAAGTPDAPLELRPPVGVRYGGIVKDADGNRVAGVTVHYRAQWQPPSPEFRVSTGGLALTDETGRWVSEILPDTPRAFMNFRHRDYPGPAMNALIPTDELKAEKHEATVSKEPFPRSATCGRLSCSRVFLLLPRGLPAIRHVALVADTLGRRRTRVCITRLVV
jgi:hypothetical protein